MTEYEQYVLQLLMSIYWELVKVPDPKQTPRDISLIAEVQDFIKQQTSQSPSSPATEGEMNREPGYYWIWNTHDREWQPAEWNGNVWLLLTDERWYRDSDLEGMYLGPIGPKIEPPPDRTNLSDAGSSPDEPLKPGA